MAKCKSCNKDFGYFDLENGLCKSCKTNHAKNIILTTESTSNIEIKERLGIISAECVYGVNIFKDLMASVRDLVGGRNKSSQSILKEARVQVLEELKEEALMIGANAVVAVDIDYSEISGGGKSMLFVVATGTAVLAKV